MRSGFAALPVLGCLIAAGLVAAVVTTGAMQRQRAHHLRLAAIQAEEFALGLRRLPPGTVLAVNGWTLRREVGAVEVSDSRGRLRLRDDGHGRWEPAP